jgi:hypothetical protein
MKTISERLLKLCSICLLAGMVFLFADGKAYAQTCGAISIGGITGNPAGCGYGSISMSNTAVTTAGIDPASIRVCVVRNVNPYNDTITAGGWAILVGGTTIPNVPAGNYRITMRAICTFSQTVVTSNTTTVTVGSTVADFNANLVQGSDADIFGTRPAIGSCPNGRIQMAITGGSFPYRVEIYPGASATGTPYDVVQFDGQMYPGTIYANYYSVNVPAGQYTIKVLDNCALSPAPFTETVPSVSAADFKKGMLCTTQYINSPYPSNNPWNVVKVIWAYTNNTSISSYIPYKYWSSIYNNGFNMGGEGILEYTAKLSTESWASAGALVWKSFNSGMNPISDTISSARAARPCDLWNKTYDIRIRFKGCPNTEITSPTDFTSVNLVAAQINPSISYINDPNNPTYDNCGNVINPAVRRVSTGNSYYGTCSTGS